MSEFIIPPRIKIPGSGRKKGTKNKESLSVQLKAQELGIDPFTILLHFAKGDWKSLGYEGKTITKYTRDGEAYEIDVITPDHRLKAAGDACQYLYPRLKVIDATVKKDPLDDRPLEDLSDEELESYDVT